MSNNTYCKSCKKEKHGQELSWRRRDYYGYYTGTYCSKCYDSNDSSKYPYRKDDYMTIENDTF
jgi:RNase P subunit RPR2